MSMGILVKGLNSVFFRKWLDFFFEFIPQLILMLFLFGWMDVLIIAKWLEPKDVYGDFKIGSEDYNKVQYSPGIITTMIDIFLNFGSNK